MKKRVLVIGSGGIGKKHIEAFRDTGRAAVSILEPDAGRREAAAALPGVEAAYASMDEALQKTFDLAVIATPAHRHVELGRRCIAATLPFLLEKPLAVTDEGLDAFVAEVADSGLLARVAYTRRSIPQYKRLIEEVQAGRIGDVKMIYCNMSQDYAKYRPDYQSIYYAKAAMGGGAIVDGTTHVFDLMVALCGKPESVSAMSDRKVLENVECEDCALVLVRFANGVHAQLMTNQFQKPNTQWLEVIGTTGNLIADTNGLRLADDDSGNWTELNITEAGTQPPEYSYVPQAAAMLDALEGKPDNLCTVEEAMLSLRMALAAKASAQSGHHVHLDAAFSHDE